VTEPQSVLSDGTIRRLVEAGRIRIDPYDASLVQPASIDLRVGDSFRVFHNHRAAAIDLRQPPDNLTEEVKVAAEDPFVIHPGEFCLGRTLEWVELPDDIVARIEGKALAIDTRVPTPAGWRTMGDLDVGDEVFGPDGQPIPVVGVSEVMTGRECREVVFSDHTRVIADADHLWEVWSNDDRRHGRVRVMRTRDMETDLRRGNGYRFRIDQTAPVEYAERDLPIDPYVLGVWLGDGTSTAAIVTSADPPILEELELAGSAVRKASGPIAYGVGGEGHTRDSATGRYSRNGSLSSRLRNLGLLGNKHIPGMYLRSSVAQRRALLAGLMDTDGYVDTQGRCDLTTINHDLAGQYHELIASLGYRPLIATKEAKLYGSFCGWRHEVTFTPHRVVFRLPRKVARQRLTQRFNFGRAIVGIRPTTSVPVRCIEVGSPRGLFLVTDSYIPTHNSSLGRLGLIVHATAGFCDPGWKGTLTLELNNLTRIPIKLYPGLLIAQLSFMTLDRPAERPYGSEELGSHYQGQVAATESRYQGRKKIG
jgi:deoxycytidine triphosphate deaminase